MTILKIIPWGPTGPSRTKENTLNIDKIENGYLIKSDDKQWSFNTWEMALEFLKDNPATERDYW